MRIYKKLLILFLCLVLCPMLIVGIWIYHTGRATLEKEIITKLEGIVEHKAKEIEAYFRERWGDVLAIQPATFIKENITIVSQFVEDKGNPEYIAAAARLDNRLKVYEQAYGYHNIALINPEGKVVYNLNKAHGTHETCMLSYEPLKAVFGKGREGISFSDVYRDENEPERLLITITAPVHDAKGIFLGEIAFDVDMQIFYELIQDNRGLGDTGETLIGKQVADGALFLNPFRYDPDAALKRKIKTGGKTGIPMLNAVQGKAGSGFAIDYRGEQVISAWRYIPSLDWGMVVKVDIWDAFAPVTAMRNKAAMSLIVCLVLGAGIVYLIVRTITLPIANLTNMAKKVYDGDLFARSQVTSRDEIGDLGKYFNKMVEGLITTNISLEQKVQERTAELMEEVKMHKCTAEELRKRTDELATILDAIPVYVWIGQDQECRVITGNRAANALFGVAPGTNVSQSVVAIGQAPYIKQLKEDGSEYQPDELPMQRSIALRQSVRNAMLDFVFPDGRRIYAVGNAVPLLDAQGNPRGSVAAFVDITERKRMESVLRESEERYSSLVVATAQIVWTTNARGEVSGDIPSWRAFTGQSVDVIKGWGWINALHPDDRERTAAIWLHAVETRTLYDTEYRLRRHDGEYRYLAVRGVPVLEKDGSIREWVGTCNDITGQRHAEQIIILKNQIANCFITIFDDEMYAEVLPLVLKEMKSTYGVFGYLDEEGALVVPTMTRDIWDKCQIPDKDIVFPREKWSDSTWPRAIREKRTICQNEVSTKSPQGHIPMYRHISLPILFQGEAIGLFQVANKAADYDAKDVALLTMIADAVAPILHARLQRDRQEKSRKRAEEKVKSLNARLTQRIVEVEVANKELESFSYSVSHDLRAPLRAIDGFSNMLLEDYADKLDAEGNRRLNVVRSSTQKMGQLIDDILAFSRMGRKEMTVQEIDMDQLVNEVYQELAASAPKGNRAFTLVGAHGGVSLPPASGDRAMIRQVLVNLISNALKFTRDRGSAVIEVGSWVEGEENPPAPFVEGVEREGISTPPLKKGDEGERKNKFNVYYVRDNGVGFDMKYADKLFGVFQRLHSAEEFEGTGAGLAIVKRIITRHGGKVWAEAKVGEGATFYFSLPKNGG